MKSSAVLSLIFYLLAAVYETGYAQQQQQQVEINREMIEAILNTVSPGCRSEMEAAIESQTEVSQDCKVEIQQAVQTLSGGFNRQQSQQQDDGDAPSQPGNSNPPRNGIHPGYWIAAFVIALFGGVAAYVMHVNKLLAEKAPPKAPKKLSKKKLEKERRKQN
mmetsp:Transcript_357/g.654  ORF Transcript_357/g.654 Transcript_357/m.654 type:complete len:162 (-) Transcript_357:171-656(-)|eukprot:CAMPEP_0185024284 /NCGR_PEP_ID=MMETSP1103-20130426/7292_1 /TAXON_ID=36769 /ORGANISM="Paraphysomonas bandaiensis, Strain Caron Lab Isolate" /LENGTH=161 /DNA_ID=CAMNT_0027557205 /DNA_START=36 /DNA_END=521 /DNA_ORIENTATION=-